MTLDAEDQSQVRDIAQSVVNTALRNVPASNMGRTRNGTVTAYDELTREAQVVIDGDTSPTPVQSILESPLVSGVRVTVQFDDPHGARVVGLASGSLGSGSGSTEIRVVKVGLVTSLQTVPDSVYTSVEFDTSNDVLTGHYDPDGWWDSGGDRTVLTVPSWYDGPGIYRVSAAAEMDPSGDGIVRTSIIRRYGPGGGTIFDKAVAQRSDFDSVHQCSFNPTWEGVLYPGWMVDFQLFQDSGGDLDTQTWFFPWLAVSLIGPVPPAP